MSKSTISGPEALSCWFGLSYASFAVLPRVLMQEMPEDWQGKMAALLEEFDESFPNQPDVTPFVSARKGNRFVRWPSWVLNYRRPDRYAIDRASGEVK